MGDESRALRAARYYLGRGWAVLPVPAGSKNPNRPGWEALRLTEADLPRFFKNGANIGLMNGAPFLSLVDVDLDVPEAVVAADYFLPATGLVGGRAGRPASHRFYVCDPLVETRQYHDVDGTMLLELRSTGTQTIVAPSTHPEGGQYDWRTLEEAERVEGGRLMGEVGRTAGAAIVARHWPAEGSRHLCALALAGALCRQTRWDDETVAQFILAVCAAAGDNETKDRLETVASTRRRLATDSAATGVPTLKDLLGEKVVWRLSDWLGWERPDVAVVSDVSPQMDGQNRKAAIASPKPTDDELRDRWLVNQATTAYGLGEWRRYRDGIWPRVAEARIEQEIGRTIEAAKGEGIRPSRNILASVTYLARVAVTIEDEQWDADAGILVCRNGALELATGTLREHRPEDYATSAVPFDFDPTATAPTWAWFLERSIPEAAAFLQEFAGYALTTDTALEIAVWLHGPPGSGKSTFISGLEAMLGRRAGVVGLADIERSRFALASLPGKTLIVATEQPASFIQSSHILNALISGEPLQIERKFKDPYLIVPHAKLCWAMNELPRISNANSGLFRRVKVVEFPPILPDQRDPSIKEQIRAEGAGILNWALVGLERLQERERFLVPTAVADATAHFVATNDVTALFIADRCEQGAAFEVGAGALYKQYRYWCEDNGHKPASSTRMAEEWRRLGFESRHTKTGNVWAGLRLLQTTETER
jgi:putative DNA primase/helicase